MNELRAGASLEVSLEAILSEKSHVRNIVSFLHKFIFGGFSRKAMLNEKSHMRNNISFLHKIHYSRMTVLH
jgi:hypothetical protein